MEKIYNFITKVIDTCIIECIPSEEEVLKTYFTDVVEKSDEYSYWEFFISDLERGSIIFNDAREIVGYKIYRSAIPVYKSKIDNVLSALVGSKVPEKECQKINRVKQGKISIIK